MKKYNVTVNGTAYEITVEAADAADIKATEASAPAPSAPTAAAVSAPAAPGGGETVSCPMPGTIVGVNVSAGMSIKKGDVLMVLEAMKMENEISSPVDGTIVSVGVAKGQSVESGITLCVIA